jgi:hypothetical protein
MHSTVKNRKGWDQLRMKTASRKKEERVGVTNIEERLRFGCF